MITILHGENIDQSRKKLVELIEQAKASNQEVSRLEAKKLTLPKLEGSLQSSSLFGIDQLLIIEELHSLPRSKNKTALINLLTSNTNKNIVLWEKRKLTPTMLKQFSEAKATEFKIGNSIFSWLDSLTTSSKSKTDQLKKLKNAIKNNGPHMCFIMLTRQIRLLIQVKDGGKPKGPPFMVSKLQRQAQQFALDKLLELHHQLAAIDMQMKSSKLLLPLEKQLDLVVLSM